MHPTQVPVEHTSSGPQLVPFGALPLGVQVATPRLQLTVPVLHASVGWHTLPGVHERKSQDAETLPSAPQSLV